MSRYGGHLLAAQVGEHQDPERPAQQADQQPNDHQAAELCRRRADADDQREGDDGDRLGKGDQRFAQDLPDDDRVARDR